jgi:hypothetical protein
MNGKAVVALLTLSLMTTLSGCGGSDKSGREETYEVSGKVTFAGSPLGGATVSFFPSAGQRSAMGITNDEGEYVLTTYEYGDGAMAGAYRVSIRKSIPKKPGTESSHDAYASGQVDMSSMHNAKEENASDSAIPDRYSNPDDSGFVADVKTDGENRVDLALEP